MARMINFLPQRSLAGGSTVLSEIFEVTEFSKLVAELRIFSISGAGVVTGLIEESIDPGLREWATLSTFTASAATGIKTAVNDPLRFIRAKVTVPTGTNAVVGFQAEARQE